MKSTKEIESAVAALTNAVKEMDAAEQDMRYHRNSLSSAELRVENAKKSLVTAKATLDTATQIT
jgi:hypothetical protein